MKNILLSAVISAFCLAAAGQQIKWRPLDQGKEAYQFSTFIRANADVLRALLDKPHETLNGGTDHSFILREYNADMSSSIERGLPKESPPHASVSGFGDYTVIAGSDDNTGFLVMHQANRLLIADKDNVVRLNQVFPLHGKRHVFLGLPVVTLSSDSNYLIVVNDEQWVPEKPSTRDDQVKTCINVYNRKLEQVWNDTVDLVKVFGEGIYGFETVETDFVADKLFVIGENQQNKKKDFAASVHVAMYDKPGSFSIIVNEKFEYLEIGMHHLFDGKGKLYLAGISREFHDVKLNYIMKDYGSGQPTVVKTHPIDKEFKAKYPEYSKYMNYGIDYPDALLLRNDGIIYISEFDATATSTGSGGSYKRHIAIIKFNFDGTIKWMKMINKGILCPVEDADYICRIFDEGDRIIIFYDDNIDNINSQAAGMVTKFGDSEEIQWMAVAVVDNDGNVKKTAVNDIWTTKIRPCLSNIREIMPGHFVLIGSATGGGSTHGYYYGFYNIE
jgi:hypothetical protein